MLIGPVHELGLFLFGRNGIFCSTPSFCELAIHMRGRIPCRTGR